MMLWARHSSKYLSHFFFFEEIEKIDLPCWFTRPAFIVYDGKINPVEHVSRYNQSMAIYSKKKALMCKLFPSSLGLIAIRWFNGLERGLSVDMIS